MYIYIIMCIGMPVVLWNQFHGCALPWRERASQACEALSLSLHMYVYYIYIYIYVCMYVCMYIYIYIYMSYMLHVIITS